MKKLRIILVFLITLLIIILVTTIILISKKNKIETHETKQDYIEDTKLLEVSTYFKIKNCMQLYADMLNTSSSDYYIDKDGNYHTIDKDEEAVKSNIFDLLSQNYIEKNKVTTGNIFNYIKTFKQKINFVLLDLKEIKSDNEIKSYLVYGLLQDYANYNVEEEIFAIVNVDDYNTIFSIEPIKGQYKDINEIELSTEFDNTIIANELNTLEYTSENDENICRYYLELYKQISLGKTQLMYDEYLNDEYKEKRFGNFEEFEKYVKNNEKLIKQISLNKYLVEEKDNYTQYTCIDQNNNYYIFKETAPMEFTLLLDNYTVKDETFINEYNKATEQKKVITNVDIFIKMINNKDYNNAYNLLSNSFKNNYFKTEQEFEKYIKANLFENNKISSQDCEEQSGLYKYKINIGDYTENFNETIQKTFIVKLNEGTGFELSFNV